MLLVRLVYFLLQHKSHRYRFRTFEQASYIPEKSGWRLKRRSLGDRSEYDSKLDKSGEIDKLDILARILLVLNRYLIPNYSSSMDSGDGVDDWIHSSWSWPSS